MRLGSRATFALVVFYVSVHSVWAVAGFFPHFTSVCGVLIGTPSSELGELESSNTHLREISNYNFVRRIELHQKRIALLTRIKQVLDSRNSIYKRELAILLPHHPGHYDAIVQNAIRESEGEIEYLNGRIESERRWDNWTFDRQPK